MFADPYSLHLENVLKGMDYAYEAPLVGGFSSGMQFKGGAVLIINGVAYNHGAILVSLSGAIDLVPLVAQGCRGVGEDLEVTECDEVVLEKVNDKSPMVCLKEVAEGLTELDKTLFINLCLLVLRWIVYSWRPKMVNTLFAIFVG